MDSSEIVDPKPDHAGELDVVLKSGRGPRFIRAAINFLATAITSAFGGWASFVPGVMGAAVNAATAVSAEAEQDGTNKLFAACLKEQREAVEDLRRTVTRIVVSINATDDQFADRMEEPRYQALVRKAFSGWSRGVSEEKREMIRRLLAHAAEMPNPDYDLFELFFDWLRRYNELHYRVVRAVRQLGRPTRLRIWQTMGGSRIRDDSAAADVFNCLVMDLSFGHVIRIERKATADGHHEKRKRDPNRPKSPYMKSAIDDRDPMELTAVGRLFVHHTMDEVIPKLGPPRR